MRIALTTLLAFMASLLAGQTVAQQVAVAVDADVEFVLVFLGVFAIACVVTVALLVAQLNGHPRRAVGAVALWSVLGLLLLAVLLGIVSFGMAREASAVRGDLPIILGLVAAGMAVVLVAWAVVRWRTPLAVSTPRFGRPQQG